MSPLASKVDTHKKSALKLNKIVNTTHPEPYHHRHHLLSEGHPETKSNAAVLSYVREKARTLFHKGGKIYVQIQIYYYDLHGVRDVIIYGVFFYSRSALRLVTIVGSLPLPSLEACAAPKNTQMCHLPKRTCTHEYVYKFFSEVSSPSERSPHRPLGHV